MKIEARLAGVPVGDPYPVRIMGVINASPESFFKGSVQTRVSAVSRLAERMTADGADFIDVGAMSTAPYLKTQISETEEARRLAAAVRAIATATDLPISVDTSRPGPAEAGLAAGGRILNDVRGLLGNPRMPMLARQAEGVIVMAHPGSLARAPQAPKRDVLEALRKSLAIASNAGIPSSKLVIDPGIGFFRGAKVDWWKWDLQVLISLPTLRILKRPLLIGVSRKSFIGHLMGGRPPEERLAGSLAATVAAVQQSAHIIRTHDVRETKEAVKVAVALRDA